MDADVAAIVVAEDELAPVRAELWSWDPELGPWVAESLAAMSRGEPGPEAPGGVALTAAEALRSAPAETRRRVEHLLPGGTEAGGWARVRGVVRAASCATVTGRSYGDPHLVFLDGGHASLQTVGEYVLARSAWGGFEVQARQEAFDPNVSLNTAVAVDVGGDRLVLRAEAEGTGIRAAWAVDGRPVEPVDGLLRLPRGGLVRVDGGVARVAWPTGERLTVSLRQARDMAYLDLTAELLPCAIGYGGLWDAPSAPPFRQLGQELAAALLPASLFLALDLSLDLPDWVQDAAAAHLVSVADTLFDYGPGEVVGAYRAAERPRQRARLSASARAAAERACTQAGVVAAELEGCVFDQAYVGLAPSPRPAAFDPLALRSRRTSAEGAASVAASRVPSTRAPAAADPTPATARGPSPGAERPVERRSEPEGAGPRPARSAGTEEGRAKPHPGRADPDGTGD